jgi:uncharacterized membrane protein
MEHMKVFLGTSLADGFVVHVTAIVESTAVFAAPKESGRCKGGCLRRGDSLQGRLAFPTPEHPPDGERITRSLPFDDGDFEHPFAAALDDTRVMADQVLGHNRLATFRAGVFAGWFHS